MIYKVSYVVSDEDSPGSIRNQDTAPKPGDSVRIGDRLFIVEDVQEVMPPRGNFQYLHASVRQTEETAIKQ